jgi:hypothetical protein
MDIGQGDLVIAEVPLLAGRDVPLDSFAGRAVNVAADLVESAAKVVAGELSQALQ